MPPTPPKLDQKRYSIACPDLCQLHPDKIGQEKAEALLALKENGYGIARFGRGSLAVLGYEVPERSLQRHLKHYVELAGTPFEEPEGRRASDVEILDAVIQSAWKNRAHWKPSLRDMLEAMAKKHAITGGSEASDLMQLFDVAEIEEEEPIPESDEALLSEAERPTEDSEDLAAPLIA